MHPLIVIPVAMSAGVACLVGHALLARRYLGASGVRAILSSFDDWPTSR